MKFKFFYVQLVINLGFIWGTVCYAGAGSIILENKAAIQQLQEKLKSSSAKEKAILKVELAKAYYKDQNIENAFLVYLEALKSPEVHRIILKDPDDEILYNEALKSYLEHHGLLFLESEKNILNEFGPILKKNPHYKQLGFIVSVAQANLGQFSEFFSTFYNSYIYLPDHYMAYKTKAILHIKLFERMVPGDAREIQREAILENLNAASDRFPEDASLYKMMIIFSDAEKKPEVLEVNLNKIINKNIIIPRAELDFFIRQALIADKTDLAQKFLEKAREWYQYSRVIDSAQEYIDNSKMKQAE